jgi:putative membrane-bound dehydrogenase-like protein
MFASFDNEGRLFVIESSGKTTSTEDVLENPTFHIRLLEDRDADGIFDKSIVYADHIPYPMGGYFYRGSLYVAAPPSLMRFTDADGDGIAEKREAVLSGWVLHHNAATLSGPFMGPDGWLYLADARRGFSIKTKEGDSLTGKGARIWRCRPDGTGLEPVSGGGFDNSVEMAFMPSGETIGTMTYFTDPKDGFRDAVMHWVEGGVYPKPNSVIEEDHLKLTGELMPVMTKLARVSHAGVMRYRGSAFGAASKGKLFTAQFHTGRVMRHVITPDGATFKTTDEPFMQSDSLDMHPTDILEDADGSLLMVNTGGWFIAGCPLSVVAKTNVMGGIYRIRKTGAPIVNDPWGRKLNYKEMPPAELVKYLTDKRPAVRDNIIEQLVLTGATAVGALNDAIPGVEDEELRAAAVFALSRINSASAKAGVRKALNDKSVIVRTAAARMAGLDKDADALEKLMQMVEHDEAPTRRQAATALGQIGDEKAIPALLSASKNPNDRFVEHAIIYSLITLKKAEPLVPALNDSSINMRKAALVALDQMDGSPLQKNQLAAFLSDANKAIKNTGIWVALHHPEWSDIVVGFLRAQLNNTVLSHEELLTLRELMVAFSNDKHLQNFIGAHLENSGTPVAKKIFLMEVMGRSAVQNLPMSWVDPLGKLLKGDNTELRYAVLSLIESHGINTLNRELNQIIRNAHAPAAFRLKAFSAKLKSETSLSDSDFQLLLHFLDKDQESPVRQSAVRLLSQSDVNDTHLLTLAKEQVVQADVFLLPGLVTAFENSKSEEVGKALITALQSSASQLSNLPVKDMQKLFDAYPSSVQALAKPLIKILQDQQASRLSQLEQLEAALQRGDVGEGRNLFFGKATCFTCHSVEKNGGQFGPDLTNIGEIRSKHDLLEAIVYPNASFAREHETSKIITKTNTYTGIITEQLPDAIIVSTGPGSSVRVPRSEISSIELQNVSMMPPGLDKILDNQELANLMAYLVSLPDGLGQIKSH